MSNKKPWLEFVNKINEIQSNVQEKSDPEDSKSDMLTFYNGTNAVTILHKKLTKE
jgi:hypothetical protein